MTKQPNTHPPQQNGRNGNNGRNVRNRPLSCGLALPRGHGTPFDSDIFEAVGLCAVNGDFRHV